ncbi:MAG TPA: TIR domain-containing protein [Steroidobacteraceae bacterium]|nr:TIR domain-containing protein [Steroidobacteraceae bacterium]
MNSIFLSYASQDAPAAGRIGEALRAAGLEVWFDQSELRGGDAWDQLIRRRIRECRLFVPIISAHTQTRLEGYFRLEWRLAVERSHLMADGKAFLVPIAIDSVDERQAEVPEAFRAVQWTHLPGGVATPAFISRIAQLLAVAPAEAHAVAPAAPAASPAISAALGAPVSAPVVAPAVSLWPRRAAVPIGIAVVALAAAAFFLLRPGHRPAPAAAALQTPAVNAAVTPAAASPAPPAHSVAVLPFTNMSGDARDDYFSDGLSEELLNTLAAVQGLKVAARTSSFSFKGKDEAVGEIARKLNVAAVLEGSVRRDKSHVRISTELIDAGTGFQRWSQTYDRDLKDVLALQTEIATSVAAALKVKLLQADLSGAEVGGTDNPKAFDAYLRAEQLARRPVVSPQASEETLRAYDAALALDPNYANAYRGRAAARIDYAFNAAITPAEVRRLTDIGIGDARKAVELAPTLGAAHSVIGNALSGQEDYVGAAAEYDRGLALSPGDARVYRDSAGFIAAMGRFDEAIARARHAVELDPLNPEAQGTLGYVYYWARRYPESVAAAKRALELDPKSSRAQGWLGFAYVGLGQYETAATVCATEPIQWVRLTCLAIVYDKQGKHAEAQAALAQLTQQYGDAGSYQQTEVYAAWGDAPKALTMLERARAVGDPGLQSAKVDPLFDSLRNDPRYQALIAQLKFP